MTAGEVLIELDPTINEAERNHLRSDLATVQLDIARRDWGCAVDLRARRWA